MQDYYEKSINLNKAQVRKLVNGNPVQFKHSDLKSGHSTIHLNHAQHLKFERAHRNKKGIRIQLSPKQAEYNVIHGKGIREFLSKAKQLAYPIFQEIAHKYAPVARNYLKGKASDLLEHTSKNASKYLGTHATEQLKEIAKDKLNKIVDDGIDKSLTHIGGKLNLMRKIKNTYRDYKDEIKPILRQAVNKALPLAVGAVSAAIGQPELIGLTPIAQSLANRAINGMGVRKRGRPRKLCAGALVPAGYRQI